MQTPVKRLFSEPLIQFFILSTVLFLFTSYVRQHRDNNREIIADNERIGILVMGFKTQL